MTTFKREYHLELAPCEVLGRVRPVGGSAMAHLQFAGAWSPMALSGG